LLLLFRCAVVSLLLLLLSLLLPELLIHGDGDGGRVCAARTGVKHVLADGSVVRLTYTPQGRGIDAAGGRAGVAEPSVLCHVGGGVLVPRQRRGSGGGEVSELPEPEGDGRGATVVCEVPCATAVVASRVATALQRHIIEFLGSQSRATRGLLSPSAPRL
jgi:hypothetical protein